ncbi:MAG: helix-turn-helix domain-containing protein [Planctomycetales bacterium]|nr:helix-turn-helix domain-containing protein [Planctomycetales bacterium]
MRAMLAVARGQHVPAVAKTLQVSERAVRDWVHRYHAQGVPGLTDQRRGRSCRLSTDQLQSLAERIRAGPRPEDGVCSLRGIDIQGILREEYGADYSLDGVYYLLHHQLKMSYLKPRPRHRRTDVAAQEAFKKTSRRQSKRSSKDTPTSRSWSGSRTKAGLGNKDR